MASFGVVVGVILSWYTANIGEAPRAGAGGNPDAVWTQADLLRSWELAAVAHSPPLRCAHAALLLLNKFLLSGGSGFRAACFLTMCHMMACTLLGSIVALSGCVVL